MNDSQAIAMTNCQVICINKDDIYNSNELLVTMNECLSMRYRQSELMLSIIAMKTSTKKWEMGTEWLYSISTILWNTSKKS